MLKATIRTLGGLEILSAADRPISIATRKAQALLIYLALHAGRPQSRTKIATLLWEESGDAQARASLRQALTTLRQALGLGPELLSASADAIALDRKVVEVDALRFDEAADSAETASLRAAAALYDGDFLDGFAARAAGFEEWMLGERYRLHARAVEMMSVLLARYSEGGQLDLALPLALRLLGLDPLQEAVHRAVMHFYVRQGRADAALRQFQICREMLQRELGVTPDAETNDLYQEIRDRRRSRAAASAASSERPASGAAPATTAAGMAEAEIRQVTVLACAFDDAAEPIDPEQIHRRSEGLHRLVRGVVESYGGSIERWGNDGALALFGVPSAHTDDVERAIRAALQLGEATRFVEGASRSGIHIGVADGRLFVSPSRDGGQGSPGVSGSALRLATALARLAAPGEFLVADETYRQVMALVVSARRRSLQRAANEPLVAWQIQELRDRLSSRLPFVGRGAELAQFSGALAGCRETQRGLTIVVRGEAGIGKTRLVDEFARLARDQGFSCHIGLVLDFGQERGAAAIPVIVRGLLAVATNAATDAEAIGKALAAGIVPTDRAMFLFDLIQAEQPDSLRATFGALDAPTRQRLRRETVTDLIRGAAIRQAVLIVVEDVHWANATTLGLIAAISAAAKDAPVIVTVTSRGDGDPLSANWRSTAGSIVTMDLGPLHSEDAFRLATQFVGASRSLAISSIERAGGNPLLLEQLLCSGSTTPADLPGSVHGVVQARMDRLDSADRLILRVASVLGQRVATAALGAMLELDQPDCAGLVGHGLLRPDGDDYLFAHAVVQESAYLSLPKADRAAFHLRAARWFASRDRSLHAAHLDRAEVGTAPRAYLDAALEQAAAYRYERALELVARGEALAVNPLDRSALARQRAELLLEKGSIAESASAYDVALPLAADEHERARTLLGRAAVKRLTDNIAGALSDLDTAGEIANRLAMDEVAARIHILRGNLLFPRGDIDGCLSEHWRGLELARRAGTPAAEAAALGGIGDAEYMRGRMRTARERFGECVHLAREQGLARVAVANQPMLAVTRLYCGEAHDALADARAAIAGAAEVGHLRAQTIAHHVAYLCCHALLQLDAAMGHAEAALGLARQLGARRFEAEALAFRAELHRLSGRHQEARADIENCLAISRDVGMDYMGPVFLGTLARVAEDSQTRKAALAEAETLLATNNMGHNHLLFRRDAIDACLEAEAWSEAERHATALMSFTRAEPLPWSTFLSARGHALAAFGRRRSVDCNTRNEFARIAEDGRAMGYLVSVPAIAALF